MLCVSQNRAFLASFTITACSIHLYQGLPATNFVSFFCLYLFYFIHTPFLLLKFTLCRVNLTFATMKFSYIIFLSFFTAKRSSGLLKRGFWGGPGKFGAVGELQTIPIATGKQLTPVDETPPSTFAKPFIGARPARGEKLTPVDEIPLSTFIEPFISTTGAAGENLTPVDETPRPTINSFGVTTSLRSINGFTGTLSRSPPSSPSLFTDDLLLTLPTIDSSATTASQHTLPSINGFRRSANSITGFPVITPYKTFSLSTNPSQSPIPAPASTLFTSAKAGIGIGAFLGLIIMILPSVLLWRIKRKHRISQTKKTASQSDDQFTKAELDAEESQRSDLRRRELPGDLAHELAGDREEGNETWDQESPAAPPPPPPTWPYPPPNLVHELTGDRDAHEAEADTAGLGELPGDMAYNLRGGNRDRD